MLQLGVSVGCEGGEKGRTRVVFTGLQQDIEEDLDRYVVLIDHVDVDRELLVEVRRSFVHDRNIDLELSRPNPARYMRSKSERSRMRTHLHVEGLGCSSARVEVPATDSVRHTAPSLEGVSSGRRTRLIVQSPSASVSVTVDTCSKIMSLNPTPRRPNETHCQTQLARRRHCSVKDLRRSVPPHKRYRHLSDLHRPISPLPNRVSLHHSLIRSQFRVRNDDRRATIGELDL